MLLCRWGLQPLDTRQPIKFVIKAEHLTDPQLLHQHRMGGIGKGNVVLNIDSKDFLVAPFLGEYNPWQQQGERVSAILALGTA